MQNISGTDAAISGLYYNPIMIVNDDARVVNKLETHLLTPLESSFTIVTCFIIQATGSRNWQLIPLIKSHLHRQNLQFNCMHMAKTQETLTEGESSVKPTSSLRYFVL